MDDGHCTALGGKMIFDVASMSVFSIQIPFLRALLFMLQVMYSFSSSQRSEISLTLTCVYLDSIVS